MDTEHDSFSFFDDPPADSPSPSPAPSPSPGYEPGGNDGSSQGGDSQPITAEQFTEMQRRLESAEKWRQDLGYMMLGQQPQSQQQPENPQALLEKLLTNPAEVLQNYSQQTVQQAQEAIRQQSIIDDRRAKHPEIAKVEHLIDWNAAMTSAQQSFYQQHGRAPQFSEALDTAITSIKQGLQGVAPGAQPPGNGGSQTVMNMDITGRSAPNSRPADLNAVSDADWPKYRDAMRRQQGF